MINPAISAGQTQAGRAVAALLEIDLNVIAANWRLLRDRHGSGPTAAVVKADGYGLGAVPVAKRIYREGGRHFFTAHLAEALAIRQVVPDALLGALNGLWPGDAPLYRTENIIPVLGSLGEIEAWREEAGRSGQALSAILHVDTGMSRLGLDATELARVADNPALLDGIALRYIMTHLVASDVPGDPINASQLARFDAACRRLPPAPRSLSASSGLFLGSAYSSDLARPGAAIYGINPTPGQPNPMGNPVRLQARVLHLREIPAGETVGYNGIWRAARPSRIATVSVGYADGFSRHLSNNADACFKGQTLPLVGRVSMDLTTFDATDAAELEEGQWLDIMGSHQDADALATKAGTNAYEILTTLGCRYAKHYLNA